MKSLNTFFCVCALLFLCACCCDDDKAGVIAFQRTQPSFFSTRYIDQAFNDCRCDSIRFYNAIINTSTKETLMAIPIENGADIGTYNYNMYVNVNGNQVNQQNLSKAQAKTQFVKIAIEERYAATFSQAEMLKLTRENGSNGVLLYPFVNVKNRKSLFVVGAKIMNGQFIPITDAILNDNPCPIDCGNRPKLHYLADMNWTD